MNSLLDLPDEVIEEMMTFLSFCDLYKLKKLGKQLEDCTEKVLKKKPFRKYMKIINISLHFDNINIV